MEKIKVQVTLDRPTYIGFKILELSKHLMYIFWYDVLKKTYGDRVKLLATDTDSLIIEIFCNDIHTDIAKYKHMIDFSNYNKNHEFYDIKNKKIPGKFKREFPGKILTKFIGLRSKCYMVEFEDDFSDIKIAKGVKRSTKKKHLTGNDYEKALHNENIYVTETKLQSKKMEMCLIEQKKLALSCHDDKRIWHGKIEGPEWAETYAHGHHATQH
jgi:hypothetical protein